MLAVEKWAQTKHPVIGLLAPQIASFAPDLYEIYLNFKTHKINSASKEPPDLQTWYSLYRNHNIYFDVMGNFLLDGSPLVQELMKIGTEVTELREDIKSKSRDISAEEVSKLQASVKNLYQSSFTEIQSNIAEQSLAVQQNDALYHYFENHKTELLFCFFVCTPCIIFYKTNPSRLYHRARLGEIKAIDALLRLDPLMLHDPSIGKQIQRIRLRGKTSTYVNIIEAPLKPIKAKITRNRIKAMLGSFISLIATGLESPLTSTDIRKLFDAIAKDTRKQDYDTSLPNSDEAFYKTIQRNREDWKRIIPTGQKKVKVLSE